MSYDLRLGGASSLSELRFPDLIYLGEMDRNYNSVAERGRYSSSEKFSDREMSLLKLRSSFYEDLSVAAFDEQFMWGCGSQSRSNYQPKNFLSMGAPKVLHAIRTFTTDVDLIRYRLDIQDDLERNPNLVPAFEHFHDQVTKASKLNHEAYILDHNGQPQRDQFGRWMYKQWANLPLSFITLNSAVNGLEKALCSAESRGMKDICYFLQQVRRHPTYSEWSENVARIFDGGRYYVAFDFDIADGIRNGIELGLVPKRSKLDKLMSSPSGLDGIIAHKFDKKLVVRKVQGLMASEMGHVLQEAFKLDFGNLGDLCQVLVTGMLDQLSFYAILGKIYAAYEELKIPYCRPIFGERPSVIEIRKTIHPVVAKQSAALGNGFVLNSYETKPERRGIVLTGPNDGGKTCAAKSFAFTMAMAQAGMKVPAEYCQIGRPVREIFTHFVSSDDIEKGKGRHKNELSRAREMCETITPGDFLLYDEPCGGTDSRSGLQDSFALLRFTRQVGLPFIFTTHLHGLAERVEQGELPGVENMQAEIVRRGGGEKLTYRIIPGRAAESHGSRISREIGVTTDALDRLLQARISLKQLDLREAVLPLKKRSPGKKKKGK